MLRMGFFVVTLSCLISSIPAVAADYSAKPAQRAYVTRLANPYCGPCCGCPTVRFVRHRELVMFYPSGFDPRTRDEPRYLYGSVRTYERFGRYADHRFRHED
jgi:hypothetical protein